MLLSIIIVSYNTKDLTLQTIKSAISDVNNSKLLKNNAEIIVVDNNSTDDSIKALNNFKLKSKFPLIILKQKQNLGFANANNLGLTKAKGKYIFFLNSDTIVRHSALETMVSRFEADKNRKGESIEKLGILAATLLNSDLTVQPQGGSFPTLTNLFFHMSMLDDLPIIGTLLPSTQDTGKNSKQLSRYSLSNNLTTKLNNLIELDWVGGTAMMIPKTALNEFGTLDQNIFMYGEDMEICIRAKNHHYKVAIDPDAQIIHLKNQSSSSENAIRGEFAGYLFIFAKHKNKAQMEMLRVILQIGAILRIFIYSTIAKNKFKRTIYSKVLADLNN
ncbi:MAG: glycosyltransferase family 2 protein [Pseudomonadales bacterium]|nr:glycosyltransferase family 2 protein [Pseudomonadales bacterium]